MSEFTPPGVSPVPPRLPPELSARTEESPRRPRTSKLEVAVWLFLLAVLVAVTAPFFMKQRLAADRTLAISSLKQMGLSLIEFDTEYGRFPDATTIPAVKAATKTSLELGDRTSNDLFRQLTATGNKSERIFWAPQPGKRRKPNDILGSDALAKGECIYSYVAGLSSSSDPNIPVAMAPMIPGTTRFDPAPYGEKAVVLRIDGSVRAETIRADTHEVSIGGGKTLLDPSLPYWHGKTPDLKWPE